ncbi:MAG: tRNA uracil 4-sulfurtransferase ThiI [Spirochaetia bacterium]
MSLFLIRLGELTLKKGSRPFFEKSLKNNIQQRIGKNYLSFVIKDGRYYLEVEDTLDTHVVAVLRTTFGIADFHITKKLPLSLEAIREQACSIIESTGKKFKSFKVETRRINKKFPIGSYEISSLLGQDILDRCLHMHVDVKDPALTLVVEIREQCYLYMKDTRNRHVGQGPGGLPVGTAGRGMLLLSGGIDSPVAGWMIAKRGIQLLAIHFHTPPYTGCESLNKVKNLATQLAQWNRGGKIAFYLVDFTDIQLKIRNSHHENYGTILGRSCMMQIAEGIAKKEEAKLLITGEALAQVASQTLESLSFTDQATSMLVLRPLVGMDKQEIIDLAEKIRTFDLSIQAGTDCCALFAPKNPVIRPKMQETRKILEGLDLKDMINQKIEETPREVISFPDEVTHA